MGLSGFLKIDDIDGESQHAGHEDEIDVHGVQWKMRAGARSQKGSGRTNSRARVRDLVCVKVTDAASPYLALACMQGKSYPEATLTLARDSGGAQLDYLVIVMTNVVLTRFEMANDGSDPGDEALTEHVALSFEQVKYTYTVQADDHSAGDEHEIRYDIAAGA